MQPITSASFGPLIAYLVPGSITLFGASEFSPVLRSWFTGGGTTAPTIGGFLYLTVASLAVGMAVSALRWACVDNLHRHTGLAFPSLDFSQLSTSVEAYSLIIKIHYEHYQYYANSLVAVLIAYGCHRHATGWFAPVGAIDLAVVGIEVLFFFASRDTLKKYFVRSAQLLSP